MIKPDMESILQLQKRWERIRVANLYDALDRMGFGNQCLDLGIRPLFPDQRLAGMAVTIRGARDPYDYSSESSQAKNPAILPAKIPQETVPPPLDIRGHLFPGSVLVIDGGGERYTGKMGEMTSWSFQQKGAKGIIVDGFIRDWLGLKVIPDYCACARGTSPIESSGRWHEYLVDVPIAMPGTLTSQVTVRPGDWIVAEADGVVVVPQEIAGEALLKAEDIEQREECMRQDLASGVPFDEAFRKWGRA
jgi:4-hydroxy-4-methyl-2-oxoglutarate aldolase